MDNFSNMATGPMPENFISCNRLCNVEGTTGRRNDIIFCGNKFTKPQKNVIFFGGDIQVTRMHSNRMRTIRSSSRLFRGGLPQCILGYQPPPGPDHTPRSRHRPPPKQTPPDQAPHSLLPPLDRHTQVCQNVRECS